MSPGEEPKIKEKTKEKHAGNLFSLVRRESTVFVHLSSFFLELFERLYTVTRPAAGYSQKWPRRAYFFWGGLAGVNSWMI